MDRFLFGAAYYDEYMPVERLEEDMRLMREAGINVIRIAESTWATQEPVSGEFDFSHVERVLEAAGRYDISVIVGTPTYAIPPWLASQNPEILAVTERGKEKYGARQNMDITSPAYRYYAERIIRKLMECVQRYSNVIGFQLDNETKHYHTSGPNVQRLFVRYLKKTFGDVEEMNREFGFSYWSNRVDAWENVPDPTGSINGSFRAEFEKFRRQLVTEFLEWQSGIVREYIRQGQFITHNLDFEWRNYTYGVQAEADHKKAVQCLDIAGCDIYHLTQSKLTGKEIAFGGDLVRSLKRRSYFVLETQAQGHVNWTPYDGQLRLHAFSHIASGAAALMYWHWHSIHNSFETYWKGILSHDLKPNRIYREISGIGADMARIGPSLINLKKKNRAALLVSNESLTGLREFPLPGGETTYNDVVRRYYDALYELNVECDILFPEDAEYFEQYELLVVPVLYSAPTKLLTALSDFAERGGHLVAAFRSGFANEFLTVRHEGQPAVLQKCLGIRYDEFTQPDDVWLADQVYAAAAKECSATVFMELVETEGADVLAHYDHPFWGRYAAVTEHAFGKGMATYVACLTTPAYTKEILKRVLEQTGIWGIEQQAAFPVIIRNGVNETGRKVHFYLNYSEKEIRQPYLHGDGKELLKEESVKNGQTLVLEAWGIRIVVESEA
ncbi:beta-galactosidase [Kineothrix sedimenti]|uniref:Beta-galactosidase n=1 Tax=Kineothrix sedimenti TaxID=3123317 RepID=A0ABZ3EZI4_9FIRM